MLEYLSNFFVTVFKISGGDLAVIVVSLLIFLVLFIDFGIILSKIAFFSTAISWILAFLLSAFLAITGTIGVISLFLVITAGYLLAVLIVLAFKVGSTIFELMIARKLMKNKEFRKELRRQKAEKFLEETGGRL